MSTQMGLPVVVSEHVPEGMLFLVGDRSSLEALGRTSAKVDTLTEVERWMTTPPREHARRIVAEVLEERRLRRELAGFRARAFMGLGRSPGRLVELISPA